MTTQTQTTFKVFARSGCVAALTMMLASPVQAEWDPGGNGTMDGNGNNFSGATIGRDRSTEMGGGITPNQVYSVQREAWNRMQNPPGLGSFFDSMYRGMQSIFGDRSWGGSDNSLSDGNSMGATGLAGGSCCASDQLQ